LNRRSNRSGLRRNGRLCFWRNSSFRLKLGGNLLLGRLGILIKGNRAARLVVLVSKLLRHGINGFCEDLGGIQDGRFQSKVRSARED
jgi:hypothetical protein